MHEEIYFILMLQFFFYDSNDSYETLQVKFLYKVFIKEETYAEWQKQFYKIFKINMINYYY